MDTSKGNDTEDVGFLNDLPDDDEEEKALVRILAGADLYVMGRVLMRSCVPFQGKTASDHPLHHLRQHRQDRLFSDAHNGRLERTTINRGDSSLRSKN